MEPSSPSPPPLLPPLLVPPVRPRRKLAVFTVVWLAVAGVVGVVAFHGCVAVAAVDDY